MLKVNKEKEDSIESANSSNNYFSNIPLGDSSIASIKTLSKSKPNNLIDTSSEIITSPIFNSHVVVSTSTPSSNEQLEQDKLTLKLISQGTKKSNSIDKHGSSSFRSVSSTETFSKPSQNQGILKIVRDDTEEDGKMLSVASQKRSNSQVSALMELDNCIAEFDYNEKTMGKDYIYANIEIKNQNSQFSSSSSNSSSSKSVKSNSSKSTISNFGVNKSAIKNSLKNGETNQNSAKNSIRSLKSRERIEAIPSEDQSSSIDQMTAISNRFSSISSSSSSVPPPPPPPPLPHFPLAMSLNEKSTVSKPFLRSTKE